MEPKGQTFQFDTNARAAIDERARNLLLLVREDRQTQTGTGFPSERHSDHRITDEDIIGAPRKWVTDGLGKTLSVAFPKGDKDYEIADTAYDDLTSIVEMLLKARWASEVLSNSFLELAIVDWCSGQLGKSEPDSLCDFISARCSEAISAHEIWVPFAHLEIQAAFEVGPVRIETVTKEMMDRAETKALEKAKEHEALLKQRFQKIRSDIQGLAAAVISIRAEPKHAHDRAIETADIVIGLLRCFSLAAVTPRVLCSTAVLGSDYVPSTTALSFDGGFTMQRRVRHRPDHWRISEAQLNDMKKRGLTEAGSLLEDSLTEFQRTVKSSLLAFSKGLTLHDANDRLIYMMSALEGLLLRGDEPIQQNVGERMAFLLFGDFRSRIETVKNFKEMYGMRSQYIHHRVSSIVQDKFETFVRNAGFVLLAALKNISKFKTKDEFLHAIDRIKFGAS